MSFFKLLIDPNENYGRHILNNILSLKLVVNACLDIGCGNGNDLTLVKKHNPDAQLFGIDCHSGNQDFLSEKGIQLHQKNIELDSFPFKEEQLDLVIANQIFEHCKEIFWINHQIFRTFQVGGHAFIGVPNTLAFHNRLLVLLGIHPVNMKSYSAHVRGFSKYDLHQFYKTILPNNAKLVGFFGSQFYPFPRLLSRFLSSLFPGLATSNFYLIQKTAPYNNEIIQWLDSANLETNFFTGRH